MLCRGPAFYSKEVEKWCVPFMGSDASVVRRTQRHNVESRDKKALQYGAYMAMPSLVSIMLLFFFGFFFVLLCQFKKGRQLLESVSVFFFFFFFFFEWKFYFQLWHESDQVFKTSLILKSVY